MQTSGIHVLCLKVWFFFYLSLLFFLLFFVRHVAPDQLLLTCDMWLNYPYLPVQFKQSPAGEWMLHYSFLIVQSLSV